MTPAAQQPLGAQGGSSRRTASGWIRRVQRLAEWLLVLGVFALQGPWTTPDVNETHYLAKAKHFWDPGWATGDAFLDSADTHLVFYLAFGWVTRWLSLGACAWLGRWLAWGLLAWSWQRLSWRVAPVPWLAPLSAAVLVAAIDRGQMAGEWLIGGCEAKGFAYALVFFGWEAACRQRWNRAWLWLGAASALHVVVGGWATIAAGCAWLLVDRKRVSLVQMAPGLVGGAALAAAGIIPGLALTAGVPADVAAESNYIQVLSRLPHHLYLPFFPADVVGRFALLTAVWGVLTLALWRGGHDRRQVSQEPVPQRLALGRRGRRLQAMVLGAVVIAAVGAVLGFFDVLVAGENELHSPLALSLLRFYWFRLSDIAVPAGLALLLVHIVAAIPQRAAGIAALAALACVHLGYRIDAQRAPMPPVAYRMATAHYDEWRDACAWAAQHTEPTARFITPRMEQTFRWYSGRPEVASWKDMPQDAASVVAWWKRLVDLHYDPQSGDWRPTLSWQSPAELRRLGAKYEADYLITEGAPPLDLPEAYRNRGFAIYHLR